MSKYLPPSQRGLAKVSVREQKAAYELTKLYRVERAARRLLFIGDRCRWLSCADLSAARMRLRQALEHVDGWSERFFHVEENGDDE